MQKIQESLEAQLK